jgi:hypothetical protein
MFDSSSHRTFKGYCVLLQMRFQMWLDPHLVLGSASSSDVSIGMVHTVLNGCLAGLKSRARGPAKDRRWLGARLGGV